MANPMAAMLMRNSPIGQTINMVKTAANPNAMVQQLLNQNPQVQQLIQQHGGDAQKAFYSACQQMGVDPEQILSQLR